MQLREVKLNDGSGGLNTDILPSGLKPNEFQALRNAITDEGGYFRKRKGKELIQYAPIDPAVYVADANTLGLWHLDETTAPYADSSGNGYDLSSQGTSDVELGLFSNGQSLVPASAISGVWDFYGSVIRAPVSGIIDGLSAVCLEAWCNISPSFSGRPVTATAAGTNRTVSNSGSVLVGTLRGAGAGKAGAMLNGVTCHRDWDSETGKDSSDCYFKFTLKTSGVAGTSTVITGLKVPFSRWLHVRAQYDSANAVMELYVNGSLHATATVNGGGVIDDKNEFGSQSVYIGTGGQMEVQTIAGNLYKTFLGIIDEVRVSSISRGVEFPYKNPRGIIPEFRKSDGTRQNICSADGGLYYTLGAGDWVLIAEGFSPTAYWDFRQMGDIMYMSNGTDNPYAWDGTRLLPMGEGLVGPVLSASAGGSTPAAGVYQYLYTYWYGEGLETGPSPIVGFTGTGTNINVGDIPTRHANCALIMVYRTKVGADTFYKIREIPNNPNVPTVNMDGPYVAGTSPATAGGADGVDDATLGTGEYTEIDAVVLATAMRKWKYATANYDRIFVAGMDDAPYALYWSETGAPDVMPAENFTTAKTDRGPLVALSTYYGEVHVSKDGQATLVLRGDNPNNWRQLETLHPEVGCVDHWSYVHRTIPRQEGATSDRYMLCFLGKKAFYGYLGGEFFQISDKISPTVLGLASANASRDVFITTTQAQFQAALNNNGSATANINGPLANVDGLTEDAGVLKIVNQLEYIGLWDKTANARPTGSGSGRVLFFCKGVGEGAFWFSQDNDNHLYYTGDNFTTVTDIGAVGGSTERIIEIVQRGSDDFYFLLTDTPNAVGNSSDGGYVYTWDNGTGSLVTLYASKLYYDLDVPFAIEAAVVSGVTTTIGVISDVPIPAAAPNNIFLNHAQTVGVDAAPNGQWGFHFRNTASINSTPTTIVSSISGMAGTVQLNVPLAAGFFGFLGSNIRPFVYYTRREFPMWRGGTFRPQSYWDATNSRLVFLASTAENASGNRSTYLRTLTGAGVLVDQYTAQNVSAFTTDGTSIWFASILSPTSTGFDAFVRKSTLAAPGTVTQSSTLSDYAYTVPLRLSYNAQNGGVLLCASKSFNTGTQEYWTYLAKVLNVSVSSLAPTVFLSLTANGDSGPIALEPSVQTVTPYATYFAVQRLTGVALYAVAQPQTAVSNVTAFQSVAYADNPSGLVVNGILSNLLFVPSSNTTGGNLWADRLYWQTTESGGSTGSILQLGVPGSWTVIGVFTGAARDLGAFTSFGDLETDYAGLVAYEFSNAADVGDLGAAFQSVTPNQRIFGFNPVLPLVQWRVTLTWSYSIALPLDSPLVNFVNVEYYIGIINIPRIVGTHFEGRSYWAVAEPGQANNNLILVYQKNNSWTTYRKWNIKGFGLFRDQLVALEDYQYVKLETGVTDLGNIIELFALSGYILAEPRDKAVRKAIINILSYVNEQFPDNSGWVKMIPYRAGTPLTDATWMIEVPPMDEELSRQVTASPLNTDSADFLGGGWARSLAFAFLTSDETDGDYVPSIGQTENVEQALITLYVSPPRRQQSVE